jgi:hypothetical protein
MVFISQDLRRGRWINNRRVKISSIGKCHCEADLSARGELPSGWAQIKYQLERIFAWDPLALTLEVIKPGQSKKVTHLSS